MRPVAKRGTMGRNLFATWVLLLLPLVICRHDDDFAFDNNEEFQVELTANHSEITKHGLRRFWGVPDTSAYVGHLFRMEIPREAFSGEVKAYKVRRDSDQRVPDWMAVDTKHGIISGIPQTSDVGSHTFVVTAHGKTKGLTAEDTFTIEVKRTEEKPHSKYGVCAEKKKQLVLAILIDKPFEKISPRHRIRALMELSHFMDLDGGEFSIEPLNNVPAQFVIMSGCGTHKQKQGTKATAIYLNVGCGEKIWSRHKILIAGLEEQARDGTITHLINLPVMGWRLFAIKSDTRSKRQTPLDSGSGAYDNYDDGDDAGDYSGYDDADIDEDDDYSRIDLGAVPELKHKVQITPYSESASESNSVNYSQKPSSVSPRLYSENHSPIVIVPEELPTSTEPETQTVIIRASNEVPTVSSSEIPSSVASPSPTTEVYTTPTTPATQTTPTTVLTTLPTTASTTTSTTSTTTTQTTPTTTQQPTTTPTPETTIQEVTRQDVMTSTDRTSTIIGRTTETVTFAMPVNQPPTLNHHMKKLAITAGKAFRYIIPLDLFTDPENGPLTFTMYENENVPLSNTSWIQFIPYLREVYGLPLESHVSRWNFVVEASDSEGQVARGPLDITVQQHKGGRTINHQFVLQFKLNNEYKNSIDWQIRALEGIVNLFRDTDMDHLTVLNATQDGDMYEFVWTNDTLPKDPECPSDDIARLMKIMESDTEPGSPSAGLVRAMQPDLKVSRVSWRGVGRCGATPATRAPDTYPPVTRNQVDHVTATAGHLLVYRVPEDTFFDPEDGGTRNLALSLRHSDRSEIAPQHWLQFDAKNQEFYGLPTHSDEGVAHYQLIAEDSSKKSAYDSLIVEVVKAPTIRPTVEFQMTLEYPFEMLSNAGNKRKVVEKLAALFGQTATDSIRIQSITDNPTTIIWYNTSLPMDRCPKKEIEELRQMIIVDERGAAGGALKEIVDHVFDKDFKVMSIRLVPLGLCAEQNTKTHKATVPVHTGTSLQNNKAGSASTASYKEWLITFVIPAVVIIFMLLVAGTIACVLYRRRRTGKMSVGDEEERQAFRSKGIPVIFQDELEERADTEPVHKSPVIMREEKPPLLPPAPDYRGDDAPYRPPPPFTASRTPPRPKATPTYRKPPPYVPP